jgi:hypothetical protein
MPGPRHARSRSRPIKQAIPPCLLPHLGRDRLGAGSPDHLLAALALYQQGQRQRRNLLPPQRMGTRVGMKAIAGKQLGPERRRKSLDDNSGQPFAEPLSGRLQRGAAPTEYRTQGPRQAREKN